MRRRLVVAFVLVAAVSSGVLAVASYLLVQQARLQGSLSASSAQAREDLNLAATITYPLAPDFQGCGYSDPDHSWEGFLIQHNFGRMDGFLQRPTAPPNNPGVTPAKHH